MKLTDRNCEKCVHHMNGYCDSWDCNMQTVDDVKKEAVNEYIKAVVEELEEAKGNVPVNRLLDDIIKEKPKELGQLIAYDKAIEIVKQGGISDDVCEWRLCDGEANVYDTSCRNPHILIEGTPNENNYEYCPYCGKKIKAGEDNANKI